MFKAWKLVRNNRKKKIKANFQFFRFEEVRYKNKQIALSRVTIKIVLTN